MADEFNPAENNIDEVKAHVQENPQDLQKVLEAEKAGKNRSTLVEHLEGLKEATPKAPVATEPAAVEVAPAEQSDVPTTKVFDKDYEVTPERGYRVKR